MTTDGSRPSSAMRNRHPADAKKPCCLFQVKQRFVNGGIGRWRRQSDASGGHASQRPEYRLESTTQRHRIVSWRCPGQGLSLPI